MPAMIQVRASNQNGDALAPLVQQVEALGQLLEVWATS
jgi:hypothetical protein